MPKDTKKRKKHHPPDGEGTTKRVRFSFPEKESELEDYEPASREEEPAVAPSTNDSKFSSLSKEIRDWMQKQAEYEKLDLEELLEESDHAEEDHEAEIDIAALQVMIRKVVPIRVSLQGYTDEQKRKSYKFECEWRKCQFMSGSERKYFLHVESHAEATLDRENRRYTCEWDLCDFITRDADQFMGHVHYHAYHTKLKVHGASMHMLLKMPSCNMDSRSRNTITNRPVTFRCEWNDCTERFNRAMHFFHHVRNHMLDQFEPGKKSSAVPVECKWSLCKMSYTISLKALLHIKLHTTQREIACYNCGTDFWSRVKYIDHCARQIELSQRKYQCPICYRYYATLRLMKAHKEVHEMTHPCQHCSNSFQSASLLARHVLYKHMKQRNFKCQQCDYAAFTKKDLDTHMRRHNDTKLFRCEEFGCNVAYKTEYAIKRHISWHYNLPPPMYECHLCVNRRYTASHNLSKHFEFVHELPRQPGSTRYRYRIDNRDGVYRLATYLEEKMNKQRQAEKATEPPTTTVVISDEDSKSADGQKSAKRKKQSKRKSREGNSTEQAETVNDAAAYAPIKGKTSIKSFTSVGLHEFAVELNIDPETSVEEPSVPDAPSATKPKEVKDFTVMKRYLKSSKNV
uniref:C2H2-type domain-containing protein n=1 Tax=Anopheles culicifacies TaxID=139723 RepID=A0A182MFQ7_9DIPT